MSQPPLYGRVGNGARLPVDFPFYTGTAGVAELGDGLLSFAFRGRKPAEPVQRGTVDGVLCQTETVEKSKVTDGMIVAVCRPVQIDG